MSKRVRIFGGIAIVSSLLLNTINIYMIILIVMFFHAAIFVALGIVGIVTRYVQKNTRLFKLSVLLLISGGCALLVNAVFLHEVRVEDLIQSVETLFVIALLIEGVGILDIYMVHSEHEVTKWFIARYAVPVLIVVLWQISVAGLSGYSTAWLFNTNALLVLRLAVSGILILGGLSLHIGKKDVLPRGTGSGLILQGIGVFIVVLGQSVFVTNTYNIVTSLGYGVIITGYSPLIFGFTREIIVKPYESVQSELERTLAVIHHFEDPLLLLRKDGERYVVIDVNGAFEKVYGGLWVTRMQQNGVYPFHSENPVLVGKGDLKRDAMIVIHKNKAGEERTIEVRNLQIQREEKAYLLVTMRDITERENQLEKIRTLYQAIEHAPYGVSISDVNHHIHYANPAFVKMTGYNQRELEQKQYTMIVGADARRTIDLEVEGRLHKGDQWEGMLYGTRRTGEQYWSRAVIAPIMNSNGDMIRYITIQNDLTKVLDHEHRIKTLQEQIKSQERMAALGQMAAGVAHELNNPIGYLWSNTQVMMEEIANIRTFINIVKETKCDSCDVWSTVQGRFGNLGIEDSLKEVEDILDEAEDGFGTLRSIVGTLKDFSRNDTKDKRKGHELNETIRKSLVVAHNEIKYVANVVQELDPLPTIEANGSEIRQVLLNLLVNAAYAIREKDMQGLGKIVIKTWAEEEMVCCSISDDGIGIPEDNLKTIFEAFYTTKPEGQGTGLGLSISHDIITNHHNGKLEVESKEGLGTTFTIKLPIAQPFVQDIEDTFERR